MKSSGNDYSIAGINIRFGNAYPPLGGTYPAFRSHNNETVDMFFQICRKHLTSQELKSIRETNGTHLWRLGGTGNSLYVSSYRKKLADSSAKEIWRFDCTADYSKIALNISDTEHHLSNIRAELNSRSWLERIVSSSLLGSKKFLFHGALLLHKTYGGLIFYGDSGVGKSTISRILSRDPEFQAIADDKIICCLDAHGIHASGTPWNRSALSLNNNITIPVNYLISIEHGDNNFARTQSLSSFIKSFARQILISKTPNSNKVLAWKLGISRQAFNRAKCLSLLFKPDDSVSQYLRLALAAGSEIERV